MDAMYTPTYTYTQSINAGMRTEMGKISAGVQSAKEDQDRTPLQHKLDEFGNK